jgi:colanic acid/amylovoran biosynthesis glycosyltransferase
MYDELIKLGVDENKLVYHPNGINTRDFPFRWEEELKTIPEPLQLITVARLEEVKGVIYGIQAVAELKDMIDIDIEYHLVGGGSRRSELESLVSELGLDEVVTFHGQIHRDDVTDLLTDSHLFLFPSVAEAFGLALLEAQAVGLPIVASDIGGIPDAVDRGTTAKLVPSKDPSAIATAVTEWTNCFTEWPKIGANGREYVEKNFDRDLLNEELIKIYHRSMR